MSGIYIIKNIKNNKCYIGSSSNIRGRIWMHKNMLKNNKHHSSYLQNSYNKYGMNNFTFQTIEECSIEKLIEREQYWIDNNNSQYNICKIAYSTTGIKHSELVKKNKSILMKDIRNTNIFKNSNISNAKLNINLVNNLIKDIKEQKTINFILKKYKVSYSCLNYILNKKTWKEQSKSLTIEDIKQFRKISRKKRDFIFKDNKLQELTIKYKQGNKITHLAKEYSVTRDTIYDALRRNNVKL